MGEMLKAVQDARMGFCGGVAVLAVQVPPHWQTWLSGELSVEQGALWIAAAAAVARGVLWAGFKMAGEKPPKALETKE